MAKIIKMSVRSAYMFAQTIASGDREKDILTAMKYRRLRKRFREACPEYWDKMDDLNKARDSATLNLTNPSDELNEAFRVHGKAAFDLSHSEQGLGLLDDGRNGGILLENDDHRFLHDKLKAFKGVPSEGEAGDIWEEIWDAIDGAKQADTLKAVKNDEKEEKAV